MNVPPHTLHTHCDCPTRGTALELLVSHFFEISLLQMGHFKFRGFPCSAMAVKTVS
jgi:hypothetical protein